MSCRCCSHWHGPGDPKHAKRTCPDADDMEMASAPWYRDVVRDAGGYDGRHRVGPDRSGFTWMRAQGNYEPGVLPDCGNPGGGF